MKIQGNMFWLVFGIVVIYQAYESVAMADQRFWTGIFLFSGIMYELSVIRMKLNNLINALAKVLDAFRKFKS